jgi:hypothetical protein
VLLREDGFNSKGNGSGWGPGSGDVNMSLLVMLAGPREIWHAKKMA